MKKKLVSVLLGTSLLLSGCGNTEARTYSYNANDTPKSNYTAAIEQLEKSGGDLELLDEFGTGDGSGGTIEGDWNPEDEPSLYADYAYGFLKFPDVWKAEAAQLEPSLDAPASTPAQALANMPLFAIPKDERTEEQWDQIFEYAASQSQLVYDTLYVGNVTDALTEDRISAVRDFSNQFRTGQLRYSVTYAYGHPDRDGYLAYLYEIDLPTQRLVSCTEYHDVDWTKDYDIIDPTTVDMSWVNYASTWDAQLSILKYYGFSGDMLGAESYEEIDNYYVKPLLDTACYRQLPYADFLYNNAAETYVLYGNTLTYANLGVGGLASDSLVGNLYVSLNFDLVSGDGEEIVGCSACGCGCNDDADASCNVGGDCAE